MPDFTLDGETYNYLTPDGGRPEETHSWEYGKYPKVMATIPLTDGGTVDVYARASRWTPTHVNVTWLDDTDHPHTAWVPKNNVRRVTDSEWDIEEYRRRPEHLRSIRWGKRLPGFLPE
jgi:hypothetical protein